MAPIIPRLVSLFRSEFRRLFTFGVIGFLALGLTTGLYALVSRVFWPNGPETIQYTLVVAFMTWLNYEANSRFTFDRKERHVGTMGRFAGVAIVAASLSSFLFWLGHDLAHILDFYVIIGNAFIVAAFTFTSHRLFTFHERPYRFFQREGASK